MQFKHIIFIGIGIVLGVSGKAILERISPEKAGLSTPNSIWCSEDAGTFSCSMHTTVSLTEPGLCPICGMELVDKKINPNFNPDLIPLAQGEFEQLQIRTERVAKGKGESGTLHLSGRLELDQSRIFRQVCHLPGLIEKLFISREGMVVRKGQAIASIYSKELIAALETYHLNKHAESLTRSALNNLRAWKIPDSYFESVDMESDYYQAVPVYSDFDGVVLKKLAVEGEYATNSHMGHPTVLYEVADLSEIWAVLDVYEADLHKIKEGAVVELSLPAFPGEIWLGSVSKIGDQLEMQNQTISVRIIVPNPGNRLKPGMLTEASLYLSPPEDDLIYIPKSAVLWTGKRSVVYKRITTYDRPVFSYCEVQTGRDLGDWIEIISGLTVGEEIVSQGAFGLDAEAQLQGRRSMMNNPDVNNEAGDFMIANQ
ncbi:MAG: efflux RND transporter periplasmic adaptor subunit [Saprospiraceae bacterium]|nr:efflux RND transporter periplasmic adaptor subunit [Saprospiraceae bacterium]